MTQADKPKMTDIALVAMQDHSQDQAKLLLRNALAYACIFGEDACCASSVYVLQPIV